MASVEIDMEEAALLRCLIYSTAVTGMVLGPDDGVYEIDNHGWDVLVNIKNKLEVVPLPA